MDGGMKYYRRYVGDYLRDTSRLSILEHGAYTLMLDYYYADERPLPKDRMELYTMLRAIRPEDQAAADKVLAIYFEEGPDGWHQNRVDEELLAANKVIDAARENGKLGGRPRNPEETSDETQPVTPLDTSTETSTETSTRTSEATQKKPSTNQITSSLIASKPPTTKASAFAPPDWVPVEAWGAFVEMRAKGRAPLTEKAKTLAVAELGKLRDQGHDPRAVLEQSVLRGWRGLFGVKGGRADSRASNGVAL